MIRLFRNNYFRRIWIMQELVVCRQAMFRKGSYTFSWDSLEHVARVIYSAGWPINHNEHDTYVISGLLPADKSGIRTIANIRREFADTRLLSLSLLMCITRRFQSTGPCNKVFALLGLTNEKMGIVPSYSQTVEEVFTQTTAALILAARSILLLSAVEDRTDLTSSLPSWFSDYSI